MSPLQPSPLSADAAALAWLVGAGVDVSVGDAPRNWLAAPPAAPPGAPPTVSPRAAATVARAAPAPGAAAAATAAAAAAAAALDLAALDAIVAGFAHPLRRNDTPPQLMTGATSSGLVIISDCPEPADSPAAVLQARMLAAIGLDPASMAEAHLLPWATGGRPPRDEEVAAFAPFAARALALAAPRLILALGDRAAALSGEARGVASLRGRWLAVAGVPMLVTFHPRRLLHQPELKSLAWADLQAFATRRESLPR